MTFIEAKEITKTYGKKQNKFSALSGINLKIEKGDSLAIVGKSGSGKSTLMHVLATLDRPTSGEVIFDGQDISHLSQKVIDDIRNQKIGFVFQQFFLNPRETVLENVVLPLKIMGMSSRKRNKKGLEILKAVDLDDKAKNKATDLSGGQKQRAVIARALVTEPEVIFADEPTGNLDSESGKQVLHLLLNLNKKRGITVIIVTHDMDIAAECNRHIKIKDGQVVGDK